MRPDWERVHTTTLIHEAELIKGMLEEHEIKVVIMNKQDLAYPVIGEIEIFVPRDHVLRAIELINKDHRS